jgi:hypothetical protein
MGHIAALFSTVVKGYWLASILHIRKHQTADIIDPAAQTAKGQILPEDT